MPNLPDENDNGAQIAQLTDELKHSMGDLKRVYNEYKEGEDRKDEDPEGTLDSELDQLLNDLDKVA